MCIANTPHNPVRFQDTIGLVIERVRPEGSLGASVLCASPSRPILILKVHLVVIDRLRWYCKTPAHSIPTVIREEALHVTDLGTQLAPVIKKWQENEDLRTCKSCGAIAAPK